MIFHRKEKEMQKRTVEITCDVCGADIQEEKQREYWNKGEVSSQYKDIVLGSHIGLYVKDKNQKGAHRHADICERCITLYVTAVRDAFQKVTKELHK
jgi:hypothetical protein